MCFDSFTAFRFKMLEEIGLEFSNEASRKPIYNEETMESTIPQLYLAGVICGGLETNKWFIENSRVHATQIISHIQKTKAS